MQACYKEDSQRLAQSGLVEMDANLQSHLSVTALIQFVWREIVSYCRQTAREQGPNKELLLVKENGISYKKLLICLFVGLLSCLDKVENTWYSGIKKYCSMKMYYYKFNFSTVVVSHNILIYIVPPFV